MDATNLLPKLTFSRQSANTTSPFYGCFKLAVKHFYRNHNLHLSLRFPAPLYVAIAAVERGAALLRLSLPTR